jgi:sugar lactone lactonase YvrE
MNPIHPAAGLILILGLCGCQETLVLESQTFAPPGSFTAEVEGPAVDADGNLYAVSCQTKLTIGKVGPTGQCEIYLNMPEGSTANGIRFSSRGLMYLADYTGHNVLQVDREKQLTVFAHDPAMNQPNDLAIAANDILFASDPNWEAGTGQLWRIDTDGKTTLLEKDMGTTNGIEVSPDNRTLYVNESVQRNVWAYDLDAKGNIANKRRLIQFQDFGLDGMRSDVEGNLYITRYGKGEVAIVSPDGKQIGTVQLIGQNPTNIAFGGTDGRTCYVTVADRGSVETFRAPYAGRSWAMHPARTIDR